MAEVDIGDIGEELGQMETEVKIAFPVSHNTLIRVDEYVNIGYCSIVVRSPICH
jgi:hypothetical protein